MKQHVRKGKIYPVDLMALCNHNMKNRMRSWTALETAAIAFTPFLVAAWMMLLGPELGLLSILAVLAIFKGK